MLVVNQVVVPNLDPTAVSTPLMEMVIDGRVRNLLVVGLICEFVDRQWFPLTVSVEQIQDVVEDFRQRNPADQSRLGLGKMKPDVVLKLFWADWKRYLIPACFLLD